MLPSFDIRRCDPDISRLHVGVVIDISKSLPYGFGTLDSGTSSGHWWRNDACTPWIIDIL